jgi:hypothetical protein
MLIHTSGFMSGPCAKAIAALCTAATLACAPAQAANITYGVSFDDPFGLATAFYSDIGTHVGAALNQWSVHLTGTANFDVHVSIDASIDRATGRSLTSGFVLRAGGYDIFEQGMAYELRTGIDANGDLPDIEITLNPHYLANELWFSPNPSDRLTPIAAGRTDATSVFVHEIGHALGFNGWGHAVTGAVPARYASTWDAWVRSGEDGGLYFFGPEAQSVYGGPVPVTNGANFHLGNATGAGVDLVYDVMGGVLFKREHAYEISPLNVAMLNDMGIGVLPWAPPGPQPSPVGSIPEPQTYAMLMAGLMVVAGARGMSERRKQATLPRMSAA